MNGASIETIPPPTPPPRTMRVAARLFKRGLSFLLRKIRMRALRAAHRCGSAVRASDSRFEDADPEIVEAGRLLRQRLLDSNERKHAGAGYRVLMLRPASITAEIWFGGLQACMRHTGIECDVLPPESTAEEVNAAFEALQPNIFIATESMRALLSLDLPFVYQYKRHHGCLRLFVPVWHAGAPGGGSSPQHDEWRSKLRRSGLTADAHFSIFEPEFHDRFVRDPRGPDVDYVTIPQSCNPFTERPLAVAKRYDYFMATSLTDERVEVTHRYVRPILRRYRGLWAGPHWGFGIEHVPPAEMSLRYAQTRIALSPLVEFVRVHGAELTHRVYAAAGCGTFQLTMPTGVTGRYFEPDELVQAGSPAQYARMFAHYVDRPLERNAVALRALRRAYGEHTCFHRVEKLVSHWDDWRRRGLF